MVADGKKFMQAATRKSQHTMCTAHRSTRKAQQGGGHNCCRRNSMIKVMTCMLVVAAVLAQAALAQEQDWFDPDKLKCPAWVPNYVAWHRVNKDKPDARYLVYDCRRVNSCGFGLGDRIRGIKFLMRLAESMNRVLILDIMSPLPFVELFQPSAFDWRSGQLDYNSSTNMYLTNKVLFAASSNGTMHNSTVKFLVTEGNNMIGNQWTGAPGVAPTDMPQASIWRCLWRALFKPSDMLQQMTTARLQEMNLTPATPFVAVHIRLGGMVGEGRIDRFDAMTTLHQSLTCARQLADNHAILGPIVIITDNHELKRLMLEGIILNVTTSRVNPVHLGTTANYHLDTKTYVGTLADMGVMAAAKYLVADGGGGFGQQARNWGSHAGFWELRGCMQRIVQQLGRSVIERLMLEPVTNITVRPLKHGHGWHALPVHRIQSQ